MATAALVDPPDFSEPWKFSDIVLVVEDRRFYVHRNILALWSPVFEKMFTAAFQERNKEEIPLPDKKANEIKELLLMIYPNVTGKPWIRVTHDNCYFLAKLAQEYQIDAIVIQCEDFLVDKMGKGKDIISELIFAQTYKMEKLVLNRITEASQLSIKELNGHEMCDQIDPSIYKKIVEGIVCRLEGELKTVQSMPDGIRDIKEKCLRELLEVATLLTKHAYQKNRRYDYVDTTNLDTHLFILEQDKQEHRCTWDSGTICPGLNEVSRHLKSIKEALEGLPDNELQTEKCSSGREDLWTVIRRFIPWPLSGK